MINRILEIEKDMLISENKILKQEIEKQDNKIKELEATNERLLRSLEAIKTKYKWKWMDDTKPTVYSKDVEIRKQKNNAVDNFVVQIE